MESSTLKSHNSFKNKKNTKATNAFARSSLIFKLQQEILKFNNTCLYWSSSKTDEETNFLNLENPSFENVSFSQ